MLMPDASPPRRSTLHTAAAAERTAAHVFY